MKQTIRIETFETNSSSYHSISIRKKSDKKVLQEIEVGKETILTGKIDYKTIGYTESYSFVSRTKLDKANMLCRYISAVMQSWLDECDDYDEYINNGADSDERRARRKEVGLKQPLFTALKKAITNYTNAPVNFDFSKAPKWEDWFESVYDESKDLSDIIGISDYSNEEKLVEAYSRVIFDDDLEIIEECESNE